MDFIEKLSDILHAQDRLESLNQREIDSLYQVDPKVLSSTTPDRISQLADSLNRIIEEKGKIRNLLQKALLDEKTNVDGTTLRVDYKIQKEFIENFELLVELRTNLDNKLQNEQWIANQDWNQIALDIKNLQDKLLRVEATIADSFYELDKRVQKL